jgi:uncharacterized protein YkwD
VNQRLFALAAVLLIAAAGVLFSPAPSSAAPDLDTDEQEFLRLINEYRVDNGRVELVSQQDLNEAADWYVTDMATKNYYGGSTYCAQFNLPAHCDSLGRMPPARAQAFGYPQGVGENLAAGFSSAQAVFNAWKASSGHNANMLGSSYRAIGIGKACNSSSYYGCYWVTDFGLYTGPGSPPGPEGPTATPQPSTSPTSSSSATPTKSPTPTPVPTTPTATPVPTTSPVPTQATLVWDDINCDGNVTPDDAVRLLRGDLGIDDGGGGCPAVSEHVLVNGVQRSWGDTDCRFGVQVLDSIKLLGYLAGLGLEGFLFGCPAPGTPF